MIGISLESTRGFEFCMTNSSNLIKHGVSHVNYYTERDAYTRTVTGMLASERFLSIQYL
jgi:hypothetical protein